MELNSFLTALIISLRNLFPSILLIGIVWTALQRIKQVDCYKKVRLGISGGFIASYLLGFFLWEIIKDTNSTQNNILIWTPLIINFITLIAIILLIWFLIWYSQQAHFISQVGDTNIILMGKNSPTLIFLLVLVLILNRATEIVLFVASQYPNNLISYSLGAIAGLLLGIMMMGGIYYWQQKLNLSSFFSTIGLLLSLMVGGMTVTMLKNINDSLSFINQISNHQNYCLFNQDSCLLGSAIANFQNFLPDNRFPGILLKIIFGYQQEIYLLQLIIYIILVTILIKWYFDNWKSKV